MPLQFNGRPVVHIPFSTKDILDSNPEFKQSASWLCSRTPKVVGPVGLLYVAQREFAVIYPHDKCVSVIGSDDATTCVIVSIRHSVSGVLCLFHFDGSGLEEGLVNMLSKIESLSSSCPSAKYEVHIVGGFDDDRQLSGSLIHSLLQELQKQPALLDVITLCVGESNTVIRGGINRPIIGGLGINIKSGEIFPATFPDKGPDMAIRCARYLTGSQQILDVYDSNLGLLRIGPFNYEPLRGVDLWLSQSDSFILQHLSTSPQCEPPHFVADIRAALRQIQLHPFPSVTVFPGNEPRLFRMDSSGRWLPFTNQYNQ